MLQDLTHAELDICCMSTTFNIYLFLTNLIFGLCNSFSFCIRLIIQLPTGKLGAKSYVPDGLSKAQYEKLRTGERAKKEANYQKNVAKGGKFLDYTKFYLDRGTDTNASWYDRVDGGHRMAKTKYDYSGTQGDEPMFGGVGVKGKKAGKKVLKKKISKK